MIFKAVILMKIQTLRYIDICPQSVEYSEQLFSILYKRLIV